MPGPRPSFALSRDLSPHDPASADGFAAWQARIDAGPTGTRMDPELAAKILANEAVLLGRPEHAIDGRGSGRGRWR